MPRTQRVSDDTESPLRMLVITGPRPPANAAGDRDTFRATDVLENLEPTLALCCNGKDERDAHLSLSTMNRNALGIAPLNEVDTDRVTARLQRPGVAGPLPQVPEPGVHPRHALRLQPLGRSQQDL